MSRHRTLKGKNIHGPYRRLFANAAERLGDTEVYVAEESIAGGGENPAIALQVDTLTEWVLYNHDPITWVAQTVVVGPHLFGGADHLPSTLEQVNTKISDADIFPRIATEPTGFTNRVDSVLTIDEGTRTFSIEPIGASYDIWIAGKRYPKTVLESIVWPDAEGLHAFYFDTSGVLQTTQVYSNDLILKYAFITYIYWDVDSQLALRFGEERHGLIMDGEDHLHWHLTSGARWVSGLGLANIIADGTGNLDAEAQFSVNDGYIRDEDIHLFIQDNAPQDLSPIAQVPIFYRIGAATTWRKKIADDFPMVYQGTAGYPAGLRLPYNSYVGGVWGFTEAGNNSFICMHFYATNDKVEPFVGVQGQRQYGSIGEARLGALGELRNIKLTGLPGPEMVPIATNILQTSSGYTNTPLARIRSTELGYDYIDYRLSDLQSGGGVATESIFGRDYQRVDSEAESSTVSATFQDKVQLITPTLTGTYRIGWSAQINNNDKKAEMRLYNITDATTLGQLQPYRIKDAADRYPRYTASKEVVFTGAAKTFAVQWRSIDGNEAFIRGAYIEFWRVK